MNIKKTILTSVLALVISGSAYAMKPAPHGPCGKPAKRAPNVERLQKELDLSDSQVVSLKQLFQEKEEQLRQHEKQCREDHELMTKELSKILTPDQLKDFEMMKKPRRQEH